MLLIVCPFPECRARTHRPRFSTTLSILRFLVHAKKRPPPSKPEPAVVSLKPLLLGRLKEVYILTLSSLLHPRRIPFLPLTQTMLCRCACVRVSWLNLSPAISVLYHHEILTSCLYVLCQLSLSHSLFILSFILCHENVSLEGQENPRDVIQHRLLHHLTHLSAACRRVDPSFSLRTPYLRSLSLHPGFPPVTGSLIASLLCYSVCAVGVALDSVSSQYSFPKKKKISSILGDLSII